ncbi:Hsp20/alpha crystallin family protein, partial [Polymorphospora sp. 2-325]
SLLVDRGDAPREACSGSAESIFGRVPRVRRKARRTALEEVSVVLTFDPFREFDRVAGQVFGTGTAIAGAATQAMPLDLYRSGDHYVLHCDLAGVDPGSVQVDVDRRVLTIRAKRSARTDDDVQWVRRERPTGTFERRIALGDGLDLDKIAATWQDGVLTLTIPLAEASKPRRIAITATDGRRHEVVEGSATPALTKS